MRTTLLYAVALLVIFSSCENAEVSGTTRSSIAVADTIAIDYNDSLTSPERTLIKTADFKCRVDNVLAAARQMEMLTKKLGGLITESRLENNWSNSEQVYYKPDSLKVVQTYAPVAYLTLRVPDETLDSVVNSLSSMSGFIEVRTLKQEDATLQFLGNSLKNQFAQTAEKAKGGKAEEVAYNDIRQEQYIERKIQSLQLKERVNYSTVSVELYQPLLTQTQVIFNPDHAKAIPYADQLTNALDRGWHLLKMLTLAIVLLWPMWLIGFAVAIFYRHGKLRKLKGV